MRRRLCDWCHEDVDECVCGVAAMELDLSEDLAFGFHIEHAPNDEEDECL